MRDPQPGERVLKHLGRATRAAAGGSLLAHLKHQRQRRIELAYGVGVGISQVLCLHLSWEAVQVRLHLERGRRLERDHRSQLRRPDLPQLRTTVTVALDHLVFDQVRHGIGQSLVVREHAPHDVRHVVALGYDVDAREYSARIARCHLHAHRGHAGHEADLLAQDSGCVALLRLVSFVLWHHVYQHIGCSAPHLVDRRRPLVHFP